MFTWSQLLRWLICPVLIVATTTVVFWGVGEFAYVDYDDPAYISGNPYVNSGLEVENIRWAFTFEESKGRPLHEGVRNLYHPVTWLSHMLDVEVFGVRNPGAQHVVNVVIHALSGILVYLIFLKLLNHHGIACVTALLFCVHPLHVESVAWLSQRKDTLSAFFAFASVLSYQFHATHGGGCVRSSMHSNRAGAMRGRYLSIFREKGYFKWISVTFFILALLSKPSVLALPAILILLDQYSQHRMNEWELRFFKAQLIDKLPWIIPSVIIGAVAIYFQQGGSHGDFMSGSGFFQRIIQIPTRLGYYLYHTVNPTRLSFHYPPPALPPLIFGLGSAGILIVFTTLGFRFRRQFPLLIFALLWLYLWMLPMSGMVYVGSSFISDRYTYIALSGLFACFAAVVFRWAPRGTAVGLLSLVVVACAWLARQQAGVWRDSYTLFLHAIHSQPRDPVGYVNLGVKYLADGNTERATHYLLKAIEIAPNDYMAHHNLSQIYLAGQKWELAESSLLKVMEVYPNYRPSVKALAGLYREVPEMYDLENALIFTKHYNRLAGERDAGMLGIEIEILLALGRDEEAKLRARKLLELPNLTIEARRFLEELEKD